MVVLFATTCISYDVIHTLIVLINNIFHKDDLLQSFNLKKHTFTMNRTVHASPYRRWRWRSLRVTGEGCIFCSAIIISRNCWLRAACFFTVFRFSLWIRLYITGVHIASIYTYWGNLCWAISLSSCSWLCRSFDSGVGWFMMVTTVRCRWSQWLHHLIHQWCFAKIKGELQQIIQHIIYI